MLITELLRHRKVILQQKPLMGYADASCVLKVNIHCQACKMRILEVLNSICGMYNVDINSEEGLVRVDGMVSPDMLMAALARTGYHAELKWVKLRHPNINRRSSYGYDDYYQNAYLCNSNYYGGAGYPYSSTRYLRDDDAMVNPNYYSYHGMNPYYYQNGSYHHSRYPPPYGFERPPTLHF